MSVHKLEEALKPCPFCGESGNYEDFVKMKGLELYDNGGGTLESVYVACRTCDISGPAEATPKLALKKWNTRKEENENTNKGS